MSATDLRAERAQHLDDAQEHLLAAMRSLVQAAFTQEGCSVYDDLANVVSHTLVELELDKPDKKTIKAALKPLRKANQRRLGIA
jgi:hypothetical protein